MGSRRAETVTRNSDTALVVVTDADEGRAADLAASLDCAVAADVGALVARRDVDTVFVCSPNRLHMPHAVEAMEHGKHVICEKPLACTPAEATAMVEAAERNRVTLKVGANLRFFANVQKAAELLAPGVSASRCRCEDGSGTTAGRWRAGSATPPCPVAERSSTTGVTCSTSSAPSSVTSRVV